MNIKPALKVLSVNPPRARWKFYNVKQANAEIERLEKLLAAKPCHFAAAADPVAGKVAPTPTAGLPNMEQRRRIAQALNLSLPVSGDVSLDRLEKSAFQKHVRFSGMRPDAELEKVYWRPAPGLGIGKTLKADLQKRINKIISAK